MTPGIGLCGAHRVGKTTLAQAVSHAASCPFLRTKTSHIFRKHGLDPAQPMPFPTRLRIQWDVLSAGIDVWQQAERRFISDRTPLDMAAYTLADIHGATDVDDEGVAEYLDTCFHETNRFFSTLIIIPPGIPLVPEPGKAALHAGYIEHLHALVVGLCHDPRIAAPIHQLNRDLLSLDDRITRILALLQ